MIGGGGGELDGDAPINIGRFAAAFFTAGFLFAAGFFAAAFLIPRRFAGALIARAFFAAGFFAAGFLTVAFFIPGFFPASFLVAALVAAILLFVSIAILLTYFLGGCGAGGGFAGDVPIFPPRSDFDTSSLTGVCGLGGEGGLDG